MPLRHADRLARPARAAGVALALLTAACGHVALTGQGAPTAPGGVVTPSGTPTPGTRTITPTGTATGTATGTPPTTTDRAAHGAAADPWAPVSAPAPAWSAWHPVLTGIRRATDGDVATMGRRTRAVLARDWTMELGPGVTVAHHRGQTRLRVSQRGAWDLEVLVPPAPAAQQGWSAIDRRPATICSREAGSCLRLPLATGSDSPVLGISTQLAWMEAVTRVALQESGPQALPPARPGSPLGTARTESPVGRLDCLLVARNEQHLMSLEGRAARLWGADLDAAALCVDVRGMVVVAPPGMMAPFTSFYTALRAGADPTVGKLPLP